MSCLLALLVLHPPSLSSAASFLTSRKVCQGGGGAVALVLWPSRISFLSIAVRLIVSEPTSEILRGISLGTGALLIFTGFIGSKIDAV